MIRFVYLGSQIVEDEDQFAFFDTVHDRFITFMGEQIFDSIDDFKYVAGHMFEPEDVEIFKRCLYLIPSIYSLRG